MHPKPTIPASFWAHVDRSGGPDACWPWTGTISRRYGVFVIDGVQYRAHRLAYISAKGALLADKPCVLHACDVRHCCNPSHLWAGTRAENSADMVAKTRQSRGEARPLAKLDSAAVAEIRAAAPYRGVVKHLALQYGVSHPLISGIRSGARWKHV